MFGAWTKRFVARHAMRVSAVRHAPVRHASAQAAPHPAYEEALKLIELDRKERLAMLERVEKEIARVSKAEPSPNQSAQLRALEAIRYDCQVKSELNLPEIRRNFALGQVDMTRPVYRYLRQKQFEKEPRAKLMERITQMNVIPDLVPPDTLPVVDVEIRVPGSDGPIEPGIFIKPEQSLQAPQVNITNFHTDTRLYTLVLVDPDSPDVANRTYQQYCHWLITNVPLSTTQTLVTGGETKLDYVPPHPQKGTKYHRYTIILYEQPNQGQDKVDIHVDKREGFDVKKLAETHSLQVRGVSFFREVWDETVSMIYKDILKTHEPVYGKPSKRYSYNSYLAGKQQQQ